MFYLSAISNKIKKIKKKKKRGEGKCEVELKQKERGKKIHLQSTDSFSSAKIPQKVRFLSLHIHKRVKKVGGG